MSINKLMQIENTPIDQNRPLDFRRVELSSRFPARICSWVMSAFLLVLLCFYAEGRQYASAALESC